MGVKKFFWAFWVLVFLVACNNQLEYSRYQSTQNGLWNKDSAMVFKVEGLDTVNSHHIFINVRNDNDFAFSNLFLIAELESPDGQTQKDTLEYLMAEPDGSWLGTGSGSVKENKLWFKENIVFSQKGVYNISINHAMRKNGNAYGVQDLEGITDVGIQIEKASE